jgi:O-antigen ligase
MRQSLDKTIAAGLLAVMIFTTLAHGAVEPWSIALFELMFVGLLLLWGIKIALDRHLEITIPATALPIAALLLLGIMQSVAFTDAAGRRAGLSMDVEATRQTVIVLFFIGASFILAANFFVTRERLFLLANVLTVFGAVVAAFALIQNFTWQGRFYWLRETDHSVFGPFVNHGHFAGYMDMLVPLPLALILKAIRGQARLVYGFAAALMGTAAIVSGSRSGIISLAAALVLLAILNRQSTAGAVYDRRGRFRLSRIGPIALVTLSIIAGVAWVGATPVLERLGQAVDQLVRSGTPDVSRAMIWQDTVKIVRDYPMLGAGLGTYHTIYPTYAHTEELFGLDYAHNDYLQILAEAGALGGVMAVWFIAGIFGAASRGIRSRDPLFAGLALAGAAGIFAVLVQSVSDTDLQIPSNALLFLVLSAVVSRVGDRTGTVGAVREAQAR